jgi:hypothetical protein
LRCSCLLALLGGFDWTHLVLKQNKTLKQQTNNADTKQHKTQNKHNIVLLNCTSLTCLTDDEDDDDDDDDDEDDDDDDDWIGEKQKRLI